MENEPLDSGKTEKQQCAIKWKLAAIFLALLSSGLLVALIVVVTRKSSSGIQNKRSFLQCKKDYNINTTVRSDSIFHDLTPQEMNIVRDFLQARPELNLTKYSQATFLDNFIFAIETIPPPKVNAVTFLTNGLNKPARRAKVIIFHGALKTPVVKDYDIALPNPSSYAVFKQTGYKQDSIPYHARPYSEKEFMALIKICEVVGKELDQVLKESFDGYKLVNCGEKCMEFSDNGKPDSMKDGQRKTWMNAQILHEGAVILPLPMQILVDHASADVSKWTTKIFYNKVVYNSTKDLLAAYPGNKITIKAPTKDDILRASSRPRGSPMFPDRKLGVVPIEPHGRRFSIDGNKITFGKWSTELGSRASGGSIIMYNTNFDNRRIAYEISLQEAIAYYSGYNPRTASSQYLDSGIGLGNGYNQLQLGTDCPENSVLLDIDIMFGSEEPVKKKNVVCVFEWDAGIPMRRHFFKDAFYSGAADRALVIRTIVTPYNYDYLIDFIFHQNGVIECKVSSTGYVQSAVYTKDEDPYGFNIFNDMTAPIHDHMMLYKVDLDVDGTKNTFTTYDIVTKNESYVWGEPGDFLIKKQFVKNVRKTEKDALINYNFDKPKIYTILNQDQSNSKGLPVGYRIHPVHMIKQLYPHDYVPNRRASWSNYQVSVTKQSDKELFGSSISNMYSGGDPTFDWMAYSNNDENIIQEDLVAWVTVGGLHLPTSEDIPTTMTTGNQFTFYLRPFNFFDEDPSMASRDGVFIPLHGENKNVPDTFGTPENSVCPMPGRKFGYS